MADSVIDEQLRQQRRAEMWKRTTIEICDRDFTPLEQLRDWDSLEINERYCDIGTGKVNCALTDFNRELVAAGKHVVVHRDGEVQGFGQLTLGGDLKAALPIELTWRDGLDWLARRVVFPDPTAHPYANIPYGYSQAFDAKRGRTTSVIRAFVDANIGPAALGYRRQPGLVMGSDPGAGTYLNAEVQGRMDNLLTFVAHLALAGGTAFDITTYDRAHTFNQRGVQDLTADVVFTLQTHNLDGASFLINRPGATRVYAGGKGELADRVFVMAASLESLADEEVWGLIESFRDDRSAEADSLVAGALRELSEKDSTVTASFTPTNETLVYKRDFLLGDIVTGELWPGLTVEKPIREVTTTVSVANGRRVVPVAGDFSANSSTGQQRAMRDFIRVVSALNTRR